MRRVLGFLLLLLSAACVLGGVVTMFAPEGDLGRSNLVEIGLVYIVIGMPLGFGGMLLLLLRK